MTSINLLKVASLPGSGSGCQSALPAEKPMERARPHRDVSVLGTVVGSTVVASYFGLPALGGQGSPIIGSAVDPSEAAPEKLEAPDPLDAWFQPGEVTFATGLNEGRDFAAGYTKQDAEESLSFYFDLAKGEKFLFRFKDWEGGPDLLDAAGGGE